MVIDGIGELANNAGGSGFIQTGGGGLHPTMPTNQPDGDGGNEAATARCDDEGGSAPPSHSGEPNHREPQDVHETG